MARNKGRLVVLFVLLAMLVAVGVLGVSLSLSASSIMQKVESANVASERLDTEIGQFDMQAARATIEEISRTWDEVNEESHQWQWQIARYVPVVGEDVDCVQRAASIADRLSNAAVMPVVEQLEQLGEGLDTDFFTLIDNKLTQLGNLATVVGTSREVVGACRDEADTLPTPHLTQINELVAGLKEQVTSVDDALSQVDALFDLAGSLGIGAGASSDAMPGDAVVA